MKKNFREMLEDQWSRGNFVCVGLDSELGKIPESATIRLDNPKFTGGIGDMDVIRTICSFNEKIVEATMDIVCAYKPNSAFYEAHGTEGIAALRRTIVNIHEIAPDVSVILDAKRADIGNTNAGYVKMAFEYLQADAITVNPYLGQEALQPFLDCKDKGIFVLCRTSNPGAEEFQDRLIGGVIPLYQVIAQNVRKNWNRNENCCLVVGATAPGELVGVRKVVGDMPILIPGIGAQGGDVEKTVKAGADSNGRGIIINSSRGIIFASKGTDFADAARDETLKLRSLINQYRI